MLPDEEYDFENVKLCEFCNRRLPRNYNDTLCPNCQEYRLLHEVKDFIRENLVNEYQVAEHFNIPLKRVKNWIREGRIEYRQTDSGTALSSMHCQRCGAPVSFGTLCQKCLKLLNNGTRGYQVQRPRAAIDDKMFYLDRDE